MNLEKDMRACMVVIIVQLMQPASQQIHVQLQYHNIGKIDQLGIEACPHVPNTVTTAMVVNSFIVQLTRSLFSNCSLVLVVSQQTVNGNDS